MDGEESNLKILIATDNHVGYVERDSIRGNDSVLAFEEVLKIAQKQKVDMVLLGGDLYHENRPSREMQHKVTRLLRHYCLSNRPVQLQFISDAAVNFEHSFFATVNYQDPNLNVGMPVFTIHGNHDDLAGKGLSAIDLLHEGGLLNMFGKITNIENYKVVPILLKKDKIGIALYGISAQRDDRLHRAFRHGCIDFLRPKSDTEHWFNILVLHQNRPKRSESRSTGAYLPESFIPDFFDLVIWGHEHECKIEPVYRESSDVVGNGIYIMQPGSSIATSLSREEQGDKKVAIVTVGSNRKFNSVSHTLQSVRQFLFDELTIEKFPRRKPPANGKRRPKEADEMAITEKIEKMLLLAGQQHRDGQPKLPLIRLRVNYTGEWADVEPLNAARFGLQFSGRVANARDLLLIRKKRVKSTVNANKTANLETITQGNSKRVQEMRTTVEDIVHDYFRSMTDDKDRQLVALTETMLGKAVAESLIKEDDKVVGNTVAEQLKKLRCHIKASKTETEKAPPLNYDGNGEIRLDVEEQEETIRNWLQHIRDARLAQYRANISIQ